MATNTNVSVTYRAYDQSKAGTASFQRSINSIRNSILGLAGAYIGARGLYTGIKSVINAAMEQEKAISALASSLKATGEYSSQTMHRFQAFAKSIQDTTTWSDDAVLSLMEYAHNLGISSKKVEEATKMGLGLSKSLRVDEQQAIKMAAAALQGQYTLFTKYIPIITRAKTEAEKFALVQEKVKIGLEDAKVDTAAEHVLKYLNAIGDLKKDIGKELLPVLTDLAKTFTENEEAMKSFANAITAPIKATKYLIDIFNELYETQKSIAEQKGTVTYGWGLRGFETIKIPAKEPTKTPRQWQQMDEMRSLIHAVDEFAESLTDANEAAENMTQALQVDEKDIKALEDFNQRLQHEIKILNMVASGWAESKEAAEAMLLIEKVYEQGTIEWALAVSELNTNLAERNRLLELTKAKEVITADKIAEAYRAMYSEMGRMTKETYDLQIQSLEKTAQKYIEITNDIVLVEKWKNEQIRKAWIELAESSDDFFAGLKAGFMELEQNRITWGQAGKKMADEMTSSMADAFYNMTAEGANWRDAMQGFFADVGRAMQRLMAQMAAEAIMGDVMRPMLSGLIGGIAGGIGGGLFGGAAATSPAATAQFAYQTHSGGIIGKTSFPRRIVSPEIFVGAPRLLTGIRSDEYPAILHKNEPVGERGFEEYLQGFQSGQTNNHIEGLLSEILKALKQRQKLSATIVDHRNVVTRENMESREGEQLVMHHVGRNR